jgi:deoxycytidylate deaminase
MPEFNVEFEVFCSCGNGLCNQSDGGNSNRRGTPYVTVEPCKKCIELAKSDGFDEGVKSVEPRGE